MLPILRQFKREGRDVARVHGGEVDAKYGATGRYLWQTVTNDLQRQGGALPHGSRQSPVPRTCSQQAVGVRLHSRLGGPKSGMKGFVFYHGQDVEGVIASGDLYIGFATFPESTVPALELAQQVVLELKNAGFNVTPPPSVNTRIHITGVDWKKRSPK